MKKANLFFTVLLALIMLAGCPSPGNNNEGNNNGNSQKISNLQTKIDNASEGDVIDFSGQTLDSRTLTINKAVTIKGGNFSGGTLKVSSDGVALQNVSNANVATTSSMKISGSALSSLTIGSTNGASTSQISRSVTNISINISITVTGGSTGQITMNANACLALNDTTASKVEISATAAGATLAVSGETTNIGEITAKSEIKIVAESTVSLPEVENVTIITMAANAEPTAIDILGAPTSFYTDQTPNFAGVTVIGTYTATQNNEQITIMKPVQNYKIYLYNVTGTAGTLYYENGESKSTAKLSPGGYAFCVEVNSNLKQYFNVTVSERHNSGNNNGGSSSGINWGTFDNNVSAWDAKVTNLKAESGNGSIRVSWTNPVSEKFEDDGGILFILYDTNAGTGIMLDNGPELTQKTFNSLTNGTKYIVYIRLWYLDEETGKMYATAPQSIEETPSASADNTIYLPPILDFTAKWDTEKKCVVLTWDNATNTNDYTIEGYYFYASTSNTRPTQPNYDYEGIMANSSRVGDETVPHKSTDLYLDDNSNPFKLAANTTYYIWALTTGYDTNDESLYSKWSEMPMATVTTGSISGDDNSSGDDNGGNGGNGSGTTTNISWGAFDTNVSTWDAQVTNLKAEPGNGSIRVSWTNPTTEQFEETGGILYILYDTSAGAGTAIDGGPELTQKTFNGLTNGTKYIFYIRLWYADEDAGKIYATEPQSIEATPSESADNTIYLPSLTNFNAEWNSDIECVILSWTDVTDNKAEGYYFFAAETNTRPTAPSYYSYEYFEDHTNRVGDNTVSQGSIEIYLNNDDCPYQLAANTTYYIWALTIGTGDEDEFLYSKWSEMPMATVTTSSASNSGNDNGGGISEEQETETTYLPNVSINNATYDGNENNVTVKWTSPNSNYLYYVFASLSPNLTEPNKNNDGDYDFDSYVTTSYMNNTGLVFDTGTLEDFEDEEHINWEQTFKIDDNDELNGLKSNTTYYIFLLTVGADDNDNPIYSKWSEMPSISVTTGSMSGSSEGGIGETAEGG